MSAPAPTAPTMADVIEPIVRDLVGPTVESEVNNALADVRAVVGAHDPRIAALESQVEGLLAAQAPSAIAHLETGVVTEFEHVVADRRFFYVPIAALVLVAALATVLLYSWVFTGNQRAEAVLAPVGTLLLILIRDAVSSATKLKAVPADVSSS